MADMINKRKRPGSQGKRSQSAISLGSKPPPMAHIGFSGSRHLIPERMPSARRESTVGIRVIDMNQETVENIKLVAPTLRRLDLSALHLIRLTDEFVASLQQLQRLDLSENELNDESIPTSFQNLKLLQELNLHSNNLTCFPKNVKRLKDLVRLKIGHNKLDSLAGIERLKHLQILMLQNNQLEYMPKEMFSNLRRLEILHIASNRLRELQPDVRFLRHLTDLDLAGNKLTSLPPELFLLPRLEVLNASGNRISRIPTINIKGRLNRKVACIDLSDNTLVKFPEHLLFMTDKLDLCKNRIRGIPLSVLKKMDVASEQELIITENPLVNPPQDVCECGIKAIVQYFQEAKANIKAYQGIKVLVMGASGSGKSSLIQSLVDQQARVTSEGDTTVGVDMYDIDHEVKEMEGTTEYNDTESQVQDAEGENMRLVSKIMNIALWDFSGHPQYLYSHYFFLHDPAIIVITFNMESYRDSEFSKTIGCWLDWIITKTNKLVVLPVGTMADQVTPGKSSEICQSVSHLIDVYIQEYKNSIDKEIKKIENMPHISTVLSDQLKSYIHLLKVQTLVNASVVTVSAKEYSGMDVLLAAIESMALNDKMFPNVMRVIPSLWTEVENFVEEKGWSMQIPYLPWETYCELVTNKFGMKHLMPQITHYLHDTGKVIWYSTNQYLKNYVFLRPSWLSDVMKHLFRHDVSDIDYNMEESYKQINMSVEKFNKVVDQITNEGIIDREFLRGAWSHLISAESTKSVVEIIVMLLELFELGYPFVKPGGRQISLSGSLPTSGRRSRQSLQRKTSAMSYANGDDFQPESAPQSPTKDKRIPFSGKPESVSGQVTERPETQQDGRLERSESQLGRTSVMETEEQMKKKKKNEAPELPKITKVVVPWVRRVEIPTAFLEEYRQYETNPALVALYKFPTYAPPGFFETMCVRALKEQLNFAVLHNWMDNMYAQHLEKPYRLRLQRDTGDTGVIYMLVELRHNDAFAEEKDVEAMWMIMLPYLREVEQLLTHFLGARVERLMECPRCAHRGFLGEWLSPKDLQGQSAKKCESCKEDIPACYLIQPKERKKDDALISVEEFLLRKLKREVAKRAESVEATQAAPNPEPVATSSNQLPAQSTETFSPTLDSARTSNDGQEFYKTVSKFSIDDDKKNKTQQESLKNQKHKENKRYHQSKTSDHLAEDSRALSDVEVDFDEQEFLQELQENSMGTFIYDSLHEDATFIGKKGKQMKVTAVQTDN